MVNDQMVNIMKRLLFLHIILLFCTLSWAQSIATGLPYECGFEESEDLSAWTLNYLTPTATDKWMFGSAVHAAGKRSMYVSAYGTDPDFGGHPNIVISYLRYKFPTANKTCHYDVSFDWKGIGDSTNSKLYVMCCPETYFLNNTASNNYYDVNKIVSTASGVLPLNVEKVCQPLTPSGEKFVCGSGSWQNVSFMPPPGQNSPVNVKAELSQQPFVFVFIWVNENSTDSLGISSIAIDNFQINSAEIQKPTHVVVYPHCEDSTLLVTWDCEGAANEFDIQYRKVGELDWVHGMSGITNGTEGYTPPAPGSSTHSYSFKKILEGSYDVRIRSKYNDPDEGELSTGYVYVSNILVYCPENHCVNYVDLYGPNVVCTYGKHEKHTGQSPFDNIGVVDYGPDSQDSKHTLHVDPTEVDPRADSLLHTVPPGALASVRLGNWNPDGNAQSITYNIHVDTATQGILILKYAVVLDNSGHDRDEEPYFRMEILDSVGNPLGDLCGKADFTYSDAVAAAQDLDSWHLTTYHGEELAWKEWTTVGVDLMQYHNQDIKVRITSADCGQWVHFGYGYFTLDCANAHIETENCGNDAQVTCYAPDGFAYEWRDETGAVKSTDQVLIVDPSEHTYTCKVSFIEEPDCYFEISTVSAPRFPVPEYTFDRVYTECQSRLKFHNTSHVMIVMDSVEQHTSEPANSSVWVFRSLVTGRATDPITSWSPDYKCRDKGDTIEVTMTTYIGADNTCDSTRVDTIITPNIIPTDVEYSYTTCPEAPYKFGDEWLDKDTTIVRTFSNFAGCDSTVTLHLTVRDKPKEVYIHDSICSDQAVVINGIKYNTPLDDYLIMMKTPNGCDSAIHLTLTVNTRLDATILQPAYACADDGQFYISYDIHAGVYDSLQIRFNTPQLHDTTIYDPNVSSIAIPYPETITPGQYMASLYFYQFCCGVRKEDRMVEVRYSSSIVEQKWNDVLTMLAPKYNGGYEFTAFQWYKNNMPLEGETHSYLYQPLDYESEYYVVATRKDGVSIATCPIQPVYHEQQSEYPSIVKVGQRVPMYMTKPADIWYYTVSGQLYGTTSLMEGYNTLEVPSHPGVYVLKSVNRDGETKAQVMIVEQ